MRDPENAYLDQLASLSDKFDACIAIAEDRGEKLALAKVALINLEAFVTKLCEQVHMSARHYDEIKQAREVLEKLK